MFERVTYTAPLQPGDRIGVTAPSSGVAPALHARLDFCSAYVRGLGYNVVEGRCLRQSGIVSAPAHARAAELMRMFEDPAINAILPPWGGELLIDVLRLLDFDAIARNPKWLIGWSDLSTLLLPLTLRTGLATLHGNNLMDTPKRAVPGTVPWHTVAALARGAQFAQVSTSHHETQRVNFADVPHVSEFNATEPTVPKRLGHEGDPQARVAASGRLIGGCLDCVSQLPGTPFGDVPGFGRTFAADGLLMYLENCDFSMPAQARALHHLRLAGWFEHANAILIGRTTGPQSDAFTHRDALMNALGDLEVPVIYDLDIGHAQPQWLLVNGALAAFAFDGAQARVVQRLV